MAEQKTKGSSVSLELFRNMTPRGRKGFLSLAHGLCAERSLPFSQIGEVRNEAALYWMIDVILGLRRGNRPKAMRNAATLIRGDWEMSERVLQKKLFCHVYDDRLTVGWCVIGGFFVTCRESRLAREGATEPDAMSVRIYDQILAFSKRKSATREARLIAYHLESAFSRRMATRPDVMGPAVKAAPSPAPI